MALIITSEEELNKLAPPALPQATNQYSRQYQDQLNNVLRLYFNRITALQQQLSWAQPVDYIDFNTTGAVAPHQIGRLDWDPEDATLELDMDYGVIQQIGQETYARVQNDTGVTIPNGTVVGFAGATDDAIKVSPYIADGSQSSLYIVGVMTHDFPDTGSRGYCTVWGFVRDVNTSAFSQGDILYASTTVAGALTNIKPTAPNNVVVVAAAIKIGTTDGIIFVRPTITQQQYYGTFNRVTDFIPALANTAYALPFTSSTLSSGVFIGTPASRIVVGQSGLYNISCTLQYSSSNAAQKNVYSWVRTNGVDIPESARISTLNLNGGYRTVLTSETASLAANDYIEIMVAVSDVAITVVAEPATAFAPGAPAANLLITQVQL
jgi:hypothetical protein